MEKYKVIVAHPGKQHSFRLASSLKKSGILYKYMTTIYYKNDSMLLNFLKKILSLNEKARIENRRNNDLADSDVVELYKFRGLVEIFLARFDKSRKIYTKWQQLTSDAFGRKVARFAIKYNVDAVINYDTNAYKCFEILEKKAPSILRIMDVSAANRLYMKDIYEKDFKLSGEFAKKLKEERFFLWNENSCDRLNKEIKLAHKFLVPSNFVKESLLFSGVKEDNIKICPYGTNFNITISKKNNSFHIPLKAIYVGNVTEMKGIYYLLEDFLEIPKEKVELTVVGHYDNSDGLFDRYFQHINFIGRVNHAKVKEFLDNSDIFVFPSLGEGLSLSVLEALSCGLPCIVSKNSGANDAIIDGKNGFVIDIQSQKQIKEKVLWFLENKDLIPSMRMNAINSVKEYSWDLYNIKMSTIIMDWLNEKNKKVEVL